MKNMKLFFLLFSFFFFRCNFSKPDNPYQKKAIRAGCARGTLFDVHLLLYPDSSFYYSNNIPKGNWTAKEDSLILFHKDSVLAILVQDSLVFYSNPKLSWLKIMKFVHFEDAKTAVFPKDVF